MEKVSCSICSSDNSDLYKEVVNRFDTSEIFHIVKCECGFIYLNPRPSISEIKSYYENKNYTPHKNSSKIYKYLQMITFRWKYNKLIKHNFNNCQLLDFGSGADDFLDYISSMTNWKLFSHDPFIDSNYSIIDAKNDKCNIVTMWHSLEHVHDIDGAFNFIDSILEKEGILFIAVPNIDAIEMKIFGSSWIAFDAPRHLHHFSEDSIHKILSRNNFKILTIHTLLQDTVFNTYSSFTGNKILAFLISLLLLPFLLLIIFLNNKYASSKLYICSRK